MSAGANVILTTGGIDDLCLKYFVEGGAMAVRRCKKADLRRIAKATGGKVTWDLMYTLSRHLRKWCIYVKSAFISRCYKNKIWVWYKYDDYFA